jgi:hypothetical protein
MIVERNRPGQPLGLCADQNPPDPASRLKASPPGDSGDQDVIAG